MGRAGKAAQAGVNELPVLYIHLLSLAFAPVDRGALPRRTHTHTHACSVSQRFSSVSPERHPQAADEAAFVFTSLLLRLL